MLVSSAIAGPVSLPFRQSSIPSIRYRTFDMSTTAAAPTVVH